jgi:23S rRNA pseudouridine2605 synthase
MVTIRKKNNIQNTNHESVQPGMVLSKYIALSGICARRKAAELVKNGQVTINDVVVREPGYRVQTSDVVHVQGFLAKPVEQKIYIILNKPTDCITTASDERGRRTVMEILGPDVNQRVYPIGRLDRNTTGVLLFTNDGQLAQRLSHPRYEIRKIYRVTLEHAVSHAHVQDLRNGINIDGEMVNVDEVYYTHPGIRKVVTIELHSGKYHIVKRLFEALGYMVVSLDRIAFAGISPTKLRPGQWRYLDEQEIAHLKKQAKLV